jgi:hypothetical protein
VFPPLPVSFASSGRCFQRDILSQVASFEASETIMHRAVTVDAAPQDAVLSRTFLYPPVSCAGIGLPIVWKVEQIPIALPEQASKFNNLIVPTFI